MYEKASKGNRVAVFVDGDNLSPKRGAAALGIAAGFGDVFLARVYGNIRLASGWDGQPGFFAVHAGEGKNAADLLLTIEAMETALTGKADHVVIATSDRDFKHLVQRLREHGLRVTVIGEDKAPETLRAAASEFVALKAKADDSRVRSKPDAAFDFGKAVEQMLRDAGGEMPIDKLSTAFKSRHNAKITDTGKRTWRAWFTANPQRFQCDPKAQGAKVRLKP